MFTRNLLIITAFLLCLPKYANSQVSLFDGSFETYEIAEERYKQAEIEDIVAESEKKLSISPEKISELEEPVYKDINTYVRNSTPDERRVYINMVNYDKKRQANATGEKHKDIKINEYNDNQMRELLNKERAPSLYDAMYFNRDKNAQTE